MNQTVKVGDLVSMERGTTYKSSLLGQPGPVLLGLGSIGRHGGFRGDALRTYGGESPAKLLVQPGQLYASLKDVTQTADLLGAVARLPIGHQVGRLTQDTVRLDFRTDQVDPNYLYWMLRTPQYRQYCHSHATGTTTMGLSRQAFFDFEIPAPDETRSALVELIGALDDKIVANSTVAKLIDSFLAEHFAKVVCDADSVPLTSIGTVATETVRPTPKGVLHYLDISSVTDGAYELPPEMPWSEAPGRARRRVAVFDTVWSTVRPNRRSHALLLDHEPNIVASTGLAVLRPDAGRAAGLYEATKRPEFARYLESVAEGSAYPAVQVGRFAEAPVPALPNRAWDQFETLALPLRERAHAAVIENRRLAATRDGLLSLLMSGEVRVRGGERRVGDAV